MSYKDPAKDAASKKAWYLRNKEKVLRARDEYKARVLRWYEEYKQSLSCEACGESDPACIEFHHKDPSEKEFVISQAARAGYSKARLLAEMAKCHVLCSNCHRKAHAGSLPQYAPVTQLAE
ncbi:hypothetical protein NITHO_5940002 [Nitrolancea hollandica Lb]|uniref:HNH endonuclease n=1 Tax=Nitrolancea hollandica Lb TaxID=1129897 RepID=I4EMD4_9BACT|nr:hypothetical protein NITHO_5940002 [Nitrolancea hollandica Lb]